VTWTGVVGIVVAGVALAVPRMLRSDGSSERVAPAMTISAPPPAPPPAPAEKPSEITVEVTSDPTGAEVWWDAVRYGLTPVSVKAPAGEERIQLTLKLAGYEDAKAAFFPTKDQPLQVTLTKKQVEVAKPVKRPKVTKPASAKPPPSDRGGPTSGGEIKPSPYEKK